MIVSPGKLIVFRKQNVSRNTQEPWLWNDMTSAISLW